MAELVRLQRYLASAGVAARRKAEELITAGRVSVNGQIVTTLGTKVDPDTADVLVDGEAVVPLDTFYVLLNKPKACITAVTDDRGRPTVMDYLPNLPVPVKPVGRLDFYTEGVLLLTNDGELAAKLLAPASHVPKTYHVKVHGQLGPELLKRLREGVTLDDGTTTLPAEVEVLPGESKHTWLGITIHEGKHRQIHRMIEALGFYVDKLQRVAFANLTFHNLRVGDARELTQLELNELRDIVGLDHSKVARGRWRSDREATDIPRRARAKARDEAEAAREEAEENRLRNEARRAAAAEAGDEGAPSTGDAWDGEGDADREIAFGAEPGAIDDDGSDFGGAAGGDDREVSAARGGRGERSGGPRGASRGGPRGDVRGGGGFRGGDAGGPRGASRGGGGFRGGDAGGPRGASRGGPRGASRGGGGFRGGDAGGPRGESRGGPGRNARGGGFRGESRGGPGRDARGGGFRGSEGDGPRGGASRGGPRGDDRGAPGSRGRDAGGARGAARDDRGVGAGGGYGRGAGRGAGPGFGPRGRGPGAGRGEAPGGRAVRAYSDRFESRDGASAPRDKGRWRDREEGPRSRDEARFGAQERGPRPTGSGARAPSPRGGAGGTRGAGAGRDKRSGGGRGGGGSFGSVKPARGKPPRRGR